MIIDNLYYLMSPIFILSICFMVGVALGSEFPSTDFSASVVLLFSWFPITAALYVKRQIVLSLSVTVFLLGWVRIPDNTQYKHVDHTPCLRLFEGQVDQPAVAVKDSGFRLVIEADLLSECLHVPTVKKLSPINETVFLFITEQPHNVKRGDRIRVRANIKPLTPNKNPGAQNLSIDNQPLIAYVNDADAVAIVQTERIRFRAFFDDLRAHWSDFLSRITDENVSSIAKALILGETASLSLETKKHFRNTGCAHLMAVSGLHLGLVSAFCFSIFTFIFLRTHLAKQTDVSRISSALAIWPTIGFALLTGFKTPVIRACIMSVGALIAKVINRPAGSIEALSAAAAVIVCITPSSIFNAGFQLSFSAAAGFVFIYSLDNKQDRDHASELSKLKKIVMFVYKIFRASLAAHATTCPITLFHFGYVSWVGPFINLFAIPFVGFLIMPILMVSLAIERMSPVVATYVFVPVEYLIKFLDFCLGRAALLPCTFESVHFQTFIALVLLSCALLGFAARIKNTGPLVIVCILITCVSHFLEESIFRPDHLTIHFFDVGQGDSTLVSSPSGEHMLVDGGPVNYYGSDAGERIVVPALHSLKISSLDMVAATHPDADHIGGLLSVLQSFPIKKFFYNGQGENKPVSELQEKLIQHIRNEKIRVFKTPSICKTHMLGEVSIRALHPCDWKQGFDSEADTNDNSLVLSINYKKVTVLLLGDISETIENKLIEQGKLPQADLINTPHHGSKTASSAKLLDRVVPSFAVISVGHHNRFGMPHRIILSRMAERNIRVFRTDIKGAIKFSTDGNIIEMSPVILK